MQSIATIEQQMIRVEDERRRAALNDAAKRLMQRLVGGCWQHELSRPFTNKGRTYRVCLKCGLARDFNLSTWKTYGASYSVPVNSVRQN
jgi:hypothetical protein